MADYIQNLSELIEGRFIIAVIGMASITIGMIAILSFLVISFKKRREAIAVNLPDINANGEIDNLKPVFKEKDDLVAELIVENEDVIKDDKVDNDEDYFLTALSYESKQYIHNNDSDSFKINMPDVGEIDYEKILKEKKLEKEKTFMNHFKELAEADKEEEFESNELNNDLQKG